jgi:hypothetical protein
MNIVSRTLLLTLLVVVLGACEDPWDRVQGEPSEDDGVAVIDMGEGEGAEEAAGAEGAAGEVHEEEATGDAEEGH